MKSLWLTSLTLVAVAPAVASQEAKEKLPADAVRIVLRVVGPLDMSNAGEKGKNIDLYDVYIAFENTADAPAAVFAPDIAKRPELANDWRFRDRRGSPHPYSIRIASGKGEPVKDAHFSVFVGGFFTSLNGGPPPAPICDYKEEWDLLRLDGKQKVERHLGYVMARKGTPSNLTVEMTLKTDLSDEQDAEAQRLIKLAGPEKREFKCSTTPVPEPKKPQKLADDGKQRTAPPLPPPPKPAQP